MRARSALPALVLLAAAALGGCSGDDGESTPKPDTSPNPTEEARGACQVEVELTGDVEQSWTGEGFVVTENQSGPVLYRAVEKKAYLTLLAGDEEFPALATLKVGKNQFTADEGVEVQDDGSGATVDATADGPKGTVDVVASFDC